MITVMTLFGPGVGMALASEVGVLAYQVPEPGDTMTASLTPTKSCVADVVVPGMWKCTGSISARGQLAGWAAGNGTSVTQVDRKLNMRWKIRNLTNNTTIKDYTDYCQGATAPVTQCVRNLTSPTTFTWQATKANGFPGVAVCVDLTGSATYRVRDGNTTSYKNFWVYSSDSDCFTLGKETA